MNEQLENINALIEKARAQLREMHRTQSAPGLSETVSLEAFVENVPSLIDAIEEYDKLLGQTLEREKQWVARYRERHAKLEVSAVRIEALEDVLKAIMNLAAIANADQEGMTEIDKAESFLGMLGTVSNMAHRALETSPSIE